MKTVYLVGDVVNGVFSKELDTYEKALEEYTFAVKEGAELELCSGESTQSHKEILEKSQAFHFIMQMDYHGYGTYSETLLQGGAFDTNLAEGGF